MIPAYNEVATIGRILLNVAGALPTVVKQIIVVDDCSTDGTSEWLERNLGHAKGVWHGISLDPSGELHLSDGGTPENGGFLFTVIFHERNRGKGAAVRTGFEHVSGAVIVDRQVADVGYGSRFFDRPHRSLYYHHYIGNRIISMMLNIVYNQMLSDIECCYKMFTNEVLKRLVLKSDGFGFEIEISAQIALARRWRIYEVGISYYGRTYEEGKKVNWIDGVRALAYLLKFRTWPMRWSRWGQAVRHG